VSVDRTPRSVKRWRSWAEWLWQIPPAANEGRAWIIVVPAEMLGVDWGLGCAVLNTRDRLAYGELMAMILIVGACGFVMDLGVRWLVADRALTIRYMPARGSTVRPRDVAAHRQYLSRPSWSRKSTGG
jgi:hypothetical protein